MNALHIKVMVATLSTTFEVTRPTISPRIASEAKNWFGKTLSNDRMLLLIRSSGIGSARVYVIREPNVEIFP